MPSIPRSRVLTPEPAPAPAALDHFSSLLSFETDCWDVHHDLGSGDPGFVLLDVRSPDLYAAGHVPGAHHLPHALISERSLAPWPSDTVFVVYCAGPHCNGADRAAVRLAAMGRRVKKMIGGVTGWLDEGFTLAVGEP